MTRDPASERAPLPRALRSPARGRVLLMAPHADDDVLGAGGTCALHVAQGDAVHVLVGYSGLEGDPERRWSPAEFRALRQAEARAGGAHLGFLEYTFWDYPEGHLPADDELLEVSRRMAGLVAELRADTIYAPWVGEQHVDHHAMARAARLALAHLGFRGAAWGYEVWTPLVPTIVVDISSVFEKKRAALLEHHTQLTYRDVQQKGLALSAQRAMYLTPDALHGEGFAPLGPPFGSDRELVGR